MAKVRTESPPRVTAISARRLIRYCPMLARRRPIPGAAPPPPRASALEVDRVHVDLVGRPQGAELETLHRRAERPPAHVLHPEDLGAVLPDDLLDALVDRDPGAPVGKRPRPLDHRRHPLVLVEGDAV